MLGERGVLSYFADSDFLYVPCTDAGASKSFRHGYVTVFKDTAAQYAVKSQYSELSLDIRTLNIRTMQLETKRCIATTVVLVSRHNLM